MPSSAYQVPAISNPTTDFIVALSVNFASPNVNLTLPTRDPLWFIRAISLTAVENRVYEIQFYSSATNATGSITTENFIGCWQFNLGAAGPPATPGYPIDPTDSSPADGLFNYYIDGLWIPYFDADLMAAKNSSNSGGTYPNNAAIHCRLVNRSASATAGGTGQFKLTIFAANQGQQV